MTTDWTFPSEMKAIIFLPTQGPHLERNGPAELHDWRVQCRKAAECQKSIGDSIIYVPSAFQQAGARSEIEFYEHQLCAEDIPQEALILEQRGLDTVEQCELALALAAKEQARLIAITCHVQFTRVRYLLKGHAVEHVIVRGTPNRWLHFTHLVLGIVFPILHWLGLRPWWKRWVAGRRSQGKQ